MNVNTRIPSRHRTRTFTSSVSIILQHCPTEVTGFADLGNPIFQGDDGNAYDSKMVNNEIMVSIVYRYYLKFLIFCKNLFKKKETGAAWFYTYHKNLDTHL